MTLKQGLVWAPLSNPTVCSQVWPPICCLPLGQSYPPGLFVSLYIKDIQAPGGLQGSRQACEEKTQFPLFFFDNILQWSLKTTLQKNFHVFASYPQEKNAERWLVQGHAASAYCWAQQRAPFGSSVSWKWGFTSRTDSLYTHIPGPRHSYLQNGVNVSPPEEAL